MTEEGKGEDEGEKENGEERDEGERETGKCAPHKVAAGLQKQGLQSRDRLALTAGKALKGISNKCAD